MAKKDDTPDTPEKSSSIIDEIQQQLEQALARKREEVEKELEERIKKEREEARKRLESLEKELHEEKQTLTDFKTTLAEFETNKRELKTEIKDHIEKAIKYQTEIESLTGQTLEELKKVSELNQKLEELQQTTGERVSTLKKDLEEKFGIVAEMPEGEESEEEEINLAQELAKLKKIKDLLSNSVAVEEVVSEEGPEEPEVPEEAEEGETKEEAGEPTEEVPAEEAEPEEAKPEEEIPEEAKEEAEEEEAGEEKAEQAEEAEQAKAEEKPEEEAEAAEPEGPPAYEEAKEEPEKAEPAPSEEQKKAEPEAAEDEASFQAAFDKLEQFRKGDTNEHDTEVSYFENNQKIVLDAEYIISTLNNRFEEAKKLHIKLSQTESPKDQFFIKQEIIKHQEALRKIMLRSIRLCEQENSSLPEYTSEILNIDILKSILEKVSMQNWSNQDDFAAFDNFSKELKDSFYTKITPPAAYLQSIMKELDIS
jgi:hypothetical protein